MKKRIESIFGLVFALTGVVVGAGKVYKVNHRHQHFHNHRPNPKGWGRRHYIGVDSRHRRRHHRGDKKGRHYPPPVPPK